jgi:hypothetical protein
MSKGLGRVQKAILDYLLATSERLGKTWLG